MTTSGRRVKGRGLTAGRARGVAVVLGAPLSFWGGVDPATGVVVDRRHPQAGTELAGRIVLLPGGRGSSSSSSVLAEAIRLGTAPAGIIMRDADPIVALGSLVAAELYGIEVPIAVLDPNDYRTIEPGDDVTLEVADGKGTVSVS